MRLKSVNKRIFFIAVLFVLIAALGILGFVLSREPAKVPAEAPKGNVSAAEPVSIFGGFVGALKVENENGGFTVLAGEQEGDSPRIPALESLPLDTAALSSLLDAMSRLRSQSLLEDVQNFAPFGLESPRAVLTVDLKEGERKTLYIGAPAPDGVNTYARAESAQAVLLVSSYDLRDCFRREIDFIDLSVTPAAQNSGEGGEAPVFGSIELAGLVRGKEKITVEYNAVEVESDYPGLRNPYRITSPITAGLNTDRGLPILGALFGLRADGVASALGEGASLADYGLDNPYSTALARGLGESGQESFSLRASAPDEAGQVYLMRDGLDAVFTAASSKLPWLDRTFLDLIDKLIILPFIDRIAAVEIINRSGQGGNTVVFSLSGTGDDLVVRAGETVIDTAYFRTFYQTLLTASYDEYYDGPIPDGTAPLMEILYHYRDGAKTDTVSFYPSVSRRVLVALNHGRPFLTYAAYVDKVLNDCAQILEGGKVLPYL